MLNLDSRYTLTPGIKFRYEDFGGIVYKRQNDQLFFLNSRLAVDLLSLAGRGTVQEIIPQISPSSIASDASPDLESRVLKILSSFKEMGLIYELAG